jgi:hypothetical protein
MAEFSEETKGYLGRIAEAQHGCQSAIAFEISRVGDNAAGCDHKHLRVGVDSALIDSGALQKTLIEAGLITEEHYFRNLAELWEKELADRTARVRKKTGLGNLSFG